VAEPAASTAELESADRDQPTSSGSKRFEIDSPLEEAVRSELVSGRPKFPVSREFTGNFIDFGLGRPNLSSKRLL
jgi:hypothetical protein